jgi:hypothetical protein
MSKFLEIDTMWGASDDFETDWEFKAQDFFMKRFNYKYQVEDDTQNKHKGCIAKCQETLL